MKNLFILLFAGLLLQSCALNSRTTIGPRKAFELGDGTHGSFKARVYNDSEVPVEICSAGLDQAEKKLLTLNPGQQKTVRFGADTKAIFKNNSDKEAVVKLKVTGDTGLSMGGPNY